MVRRFALIASALALAVALACATTQKEETTSEPIVRMFNTTVTNQTWFDLSNCFGQPPTSPARASDGVLVGLLQSANPAIMECLADPKNRGAKDRTTVTVSTKVPESGAPDHTITGDNLTPDGETCVRGVLAKVVPAFTQKAEDELRAAAPKKGEKIGKVEVVDIGQKGKKKGKGKGKGKEPEQVTVGASEAEQPVIDEEELHSLKGLPPGTAAALVRYVHDANQPLIRAGINETSDAAGQIRLSLREACSCFDPWKATDPVPFQLVAVVPRPVEVSMTDGGVPPPPPATMAPSQVTVTTPEGDATTAQVAACVKDHVAKMAFKTPAREMQIPYNFQFINSSSGQPLGAGEGWARYQQIEEISRRRKAEAEIAVGARSSASTLYDQLVNKFKQNGYSVAVKTLIGRCNDVLKADDAWAAALQKQLEAEQAKKDVVASLVKEDAGRWGDAQKSSTKTLEIVTADLAKAKQVRQTDERACPKVKE